MSKQVISRSTRWYVMRDAATLLFVAAWVAIVYVQTIFAFGAAIAAAHCTPLAPWTTIMGQNMNAAAVAVAAATVSGYLLRSRGEDWGKAALVWSIVLCVAFAFLTAAGAWVSASMLLNNPVMPGETVLSVPLTGIGQALTLVPGLAAVSTLVICLVLRRSTMRPAGAAVIAALIPAIWVALAWLVLVQATAAFCG